MAILYGVFLTDEEIQEQKLKLFNYLKAKIEAEKLNPEPDYDNEQELKLIKMVAVSNLDYEDRMELIGIINNIEE